MYTILEAWKRDGTGGALSNSNTSSQCCRCPREGDPESWSLSKPTSSSSSRWSWSTNSNWTSRNWGSTAWWHGKSQWGEGWVEGANWSGPNPERTLRRDPFRSQDWEQEVGMDSYPNWEAICKRNPLAKEKVSFSDGVSLGTLTTLRGRPYLFPGVAGRHKKSQW